MYKKRNASMNTEYPAVAGCSCGATDCPICGPLQGYLIYPDGISEADIETLAGELALNAATEPGPLGLVLRAAFCDDPDMSLQHDLAAVIRRVLDCNYPEARQSALAVRDRMAQIARDEDLFQDAAIEKLRSRE